MATYKDIQNYVRKNNDFMPKTCWIAHVMADHGLTKRIAPNRIDRTGRAYPCPDEKRPAIESALRHFRII